MKEIKPTEIYSFITVSRLAAESEVASFLVAKNKEWPLPELS